MIVISISSTISLFTAVRLSRILEKKKKYYVKIFICFYFFDLEELLILLCMVSLGRVRSKILNQCYRSYL